MNAVFYCWFGAMVVWPMYVTATVIGATVQRAAKDKVHVR